MAALRSFSLCYSSPATFTSQTRNVAPKPNSPIASVGKSEHFSTKLMAVVSASQLRPVYSCQHLTVCKPERLGSSSSMTGRLHVAMPAAQSTRQGAMKVIMMAKRQQELVDVRKMSDEDINLTVVDLKGELFLLRTKQATRQEYKSSEFRRIRKQIARMLTVRREREIERGVTMRESRKLDRKWKQSIVVRPPPSYAATLAEQEKK